MHGGTKAKNDKPCISTVKSRLSFGDSDGGFTQHMDLESAKAILDINNWTTKLASMFLYLVSKLATGCVKQRTYGNLDLTCLH